MNSERFCCDGRCNENQGRGACPMARTARLEQRERARPPVVNLRRKVWLGIFGFYAVGLLGASWLLLR